MFGFLGLGVFGQCIRDLSIISDRCSRAASCVLALNDAGYISSQPTSIQSPIREFVAKSRDAAVWM